MIRGHVAPDTVKQILDRLSKDQEFREHMLGDPVTALKSYAVDVDPHAVPAARKLPTMAQCAAARDQAPGNPLEKVGIFIFMLK
ncbi:MAG: NHLP-related RiPP peptide [Lysobacterales bacterium]